MAQATRSGAHPESAVPYAVTYLGLLALTITTFLLSRKDFGIWSFVIAMAIAVTKASLVVLIFMQLWHHRGSPRLALATALMWLALLMVSSSPTCTPDSRLPILLTIQLPGREGRRTLTRRLALSSDPTPRISAHRRGGILQACAISPDRLELPKTDTGAPGSRESRPALEDERFQDPADWRILHVRGFRAFASLVPRRRCGNRRGPLEPAVRRGSGRIGQ